MILQTIITIMFLYISYHLWKTKIWRNVKGSQQVVIIAIIAMLLATCIRNAHPIQCSSCPT